jgi:hypothetical protein
MTRTARCLIMAAAACWSAQVLADTPCVDVVDVKGQKVAGVSVTLGSWTRYTNQAGGVCFQNIPRGRYQVLLRSGNLKGVCEVSTDQPNVQCAAPTR